MLLWLAGGVVIVTVLAVLVLRDAIADDRRRKVDKPRTYSGY
jgi:hypothetical protein